MPNKLSNAEYSNHGDNDGFLILDVDVWGDSSLLKGCSVFKSCCCLGSSVSAVRFSFPLLAYIVWHVGFWSVYALHICGQIPGMYD